MVSVVDKEHLDSCTSAPLFIEYGSISEAAVRIEPNSQLVQIDWDNLEIEQTQDDEGRIQVMSDDQMFALLGLRDEDESAKNSTQVDRSNSAIETSGPAVIEGTEGAALPVDDAIPGELVISYDKNNPCMDLGSKYPSMKDFRLAVRQFAINKEFELDIVKSDQSRFRVKCGVEGCPWSLVGRRQSDKTIMVLT